MADPQTEEYRRASIAATSAAALYATQQFSDTVSPSSLYETFESFVEAVVGPVDSSTNQVINLARQNYYASRRMQGVAGDVEWVPKPLEVQAIRSSLWATAGQTLQGVEKFNIPVRSAMKRARVQVGGVVTRQVMNGARNSTIATTKRDRRALGALYITRGDTKVCYWCAMLASRGPVFGSNSFVDSDRQFVGTGTAKSHDHCRCILVQVYSDDTPLLDESHRLEAMWRDVNWREGWRDDPTRGRVKNSGQKALREWRRVWEGRHSTISI